MLHVDGRDDVDACLEQALDVLPPLLVLRSGSVGVGEFVHQRDIRVPSDDGVQIHFGELDSAVGNNSPRDHLESGQKRGCRRPTVGLHDGDDDILALMPQAGTLLEHREGLAHPGGGSEQHAEPPLLHCS